MEYPHLRTTILKLQDSLSDFDRKRLHFILANHVPRRIRDDQSINGTLNLMESLFDQDKISEQNITILIEAFDKIGCLEGLKILKEHKKQIQLHSLNQQNSRPLIPFNEEITGDQEEDKSTSHGLLCDFKNCGNYSEFIKNTNTNINPVTINVDTKQIISTLPGEQQPFYISFKTNKCLFSMVMLLLLAFAVITTVLIVTIIKINCATKDKNATEARKKLVEKIHRLENLVSEKEQKIAEFHNRVTELEEDKNHLPVMPGQKFGGRDGIHFDDSLSSDFACSHFFNGLLARSDVNGLETYEFHYYSPYANFKKIQSAFHGNEDFPQIYEFDFDKNEKIDRVEGRIVNKSITIENGTIVTKSIITGIRFTSTDGLATPLSNDLPGINFDESFEGYTLGYITGRADQYIEQLQFFWYRT